MHQTFWWRAAAARFNAPCLFLDRDGVLVEEVGYLHRPHDVRILPGAVEAIMAARANGWAVGLVTNQSGVGRGYYDWESFIAVQNTITERLGLGHGVFDFVAACGTHPCAAVSELRIRDHPWRKPNPGMLLAAAEALSLDLPTSAMVGDQLTDVQAGLAAGVGTVIHVATGRGLSERGQVAALLPGLSRGQLLFRRGLDDALSPSLFRR